ncbi:hypothetical protein SO694_00005014 [Aureococcus anophagefferens]|uniref:PLA2c domain-containing protein n=2 Tax=Aureococcus anophagefferens TaxID=44056 RepID=A0ABR1G962_AURAN
MAFFATLWRGTILMRLAFAVSGLQVCQDFKDATGCLNHKGTVVFYTCEWCVSEGQCHETHSPLNSCSDTCCASKSKTSTCDFDDASKIDSEACKNSPGALKCDEIADPEACLDHSVAKLNTCEYCSSTNTCHETHSPRNTCTKECCASESMTSMCDRNSIAAIDFDACSKTFLLNATAWRNIGTDYAWPEASLDVIRTRPSVGVGFSGGGTRAYAAAVGQTQAMRALGLFDGVRYASGVSGGAWFVSALTYDQGGDDDALLCPYVAPGNLTLAAIAHLPEGCMADATTYDFLKNVYAKGLSKLFEKDELLEDVWKEVISEAIFAPRGIKDDARAAWDADAAAAYKARSPNLEDWDFVWPQHERPYPIVSGTLMGPEDMNPYSKNNRSFTIIQYTPLYSGNPYSSTITYSSQDGCDDDDHCISKSETIRVGGLVSSYAFGGDVPVGNASLSGDETSGDFLVLAPKEGATVQLAATISSMAPAAYVAQKAQPFETVLSTVFSWAVDAPSESARLFLTADGGCLENFGVIPLLQRKLEKVVLFVNSKVKLSTAGAWDPNTTPGLDDIDLNIPALFGIFLAPEPSVAGIDQGSDLSSVQVFDPKDFPKLAAALQKSQADGIGAIADVELTTVENTHHGIPAGQAVHLGVVLLTTTVASSFKDAVTDAAMKQAIELGEAGTGDFDSFPCYDTFTQMTLTETQAYLLLSYTSFLVRENRAWFEKMLR